MPLARFPLRSACAALLALALGSCRLLGLAPEPVEVERPTSISSSGLRCEDLFLGLGPAAEAGDEATFDYTAWLAGGKRIDSTLDRGLPLTVRLGEAPLACWNEGLVGMRAGGRRRIHAPPELAYGSAGVPGLVPPDAALTFEVHLLRLASAPDEP
jgi:FKBP-type peptidyl-prolyl cis-trans isomerase